MAKKALSDNGSTQKRRRKRIMLVRLQSCYRIVTIKEFLFSYIFVISDQIKILFEGIYI